MKPNDPTDELDVFARRQAMRVLEPVPRDYFDRRVSLALGVVLVGAAVAMLAAMYWGAF
jgi:hypothetical protein